MKVLTSFSGCKAKKLYAISFGKYKIVFNLCELLVSIYLVHISGVQLLIGVNYMQSSVA